MPCGLQKSQEASGARRSEGGDWRDKRLDKQQGPGNLDSCRPWIFSFFLNKFIYLFMAALGLRCCTQAFFLVATSRGYSSLRCAGLSLRWLLVAHGLQ